MRSGPREWEEVSAPGTDIHWLLQSARELDGPTEQDRTRVWARLSRHRQERCGHDERYRRDDFARRRHRYDQAQDGSGDDYLVAALTGNTASGYAASLPVGLETY